MKFLPDDISKAPQTVARFQREAQAASALNHPNICTIHDIGEENGKTFMAMDFWDGQTLKQLIAGRPMQMGTRKKPVNYTTAPANAQCSIFSAIITSQSRLFEIAVTNRR